MTVLKLFDGDTELAVIETDPFEFRVTGDLPNNSPFQVFNNPGDIRMMDGESVDGDLALHEEWRDADEDRIKEELVTLVEISGLNVVERSELNSGA